MCRSASVNRYQRTNEKAPFGAFFMRVVLRNLKQSLPLFGSELHDQQAS
jgi:hypothetical protein